MLRIFLRIICVCLPFIALSPSAWASPEDARHFVETVSHEALVIIKNSSLDDHEKFLQLSDLFGASVDTNWMARFAAGQYWRSLSKEQQQNYLSFYGSFLMYSYVPKFREYNNQKLDIQDISNETATNYTVHTEIVSKEGKTFRVDYRIHMDKNGAYKIFDVVAEGVSLITTQRSDFGALLANNGTEHFLNRLQERITEMKAHAS